MTSDFIFSIYYLLSFILGSIPFGFLLVKLTAKIDIRNTGSGNIGATNVMRFSGKKIGLLVLILDASKGAIPVMLAKQSYCCTVNKLAYVALFAVIGHVFTPWLKCKGGKGVATAFGVTFAYCPTMLLPSLLIFIIILIISRYISLSSIAAAILLMVTAVFIAKYDYRYTDTLYRGTFAWIIMANIIIIKHYSNIIRIVNGTESKFYMNI